MSGLMATPFASTTLRKEGDLVTKISTLAPLTLAITPLFLEFGSTFNSSAWLQALHPNPPAIRMLLASKPVAL